VWNPLLSEGGLRPLIIWFVLTPFIMGSTTASDRHLTLRTSKMVEKFIRHVYYYGPASPSER
jgi:hypothetical protein